MNNSQTRLVLFCQTHQNWLLLAVFAVGLLIRLAWLHRDFNITADLPILRQWAITLRAEGILNFYKTAEIRAYPPLSIYMVAATGWLADKLSATNPPDDALLTALVKLPATLADMGTAALIVRQAGKHSAVWRIFTAAAYLFNPAVWYVSVYWGQLDAIFVFFLIAALMLLAGGKIIPAWISYGISLGFKLQGAPLIILFLIWTWLKHGHSQLAKGIAGFSGTIAIIILPWLLTNHLPEMLEAIFPTQHPPLLVQSAYNAWYLFLREEAVALNASRNLDFASISYLNAGIILVLIVIVIVSFNIVKKQKPINLPVAAATITLGAFLFLPEMRERYLFPLLPLLLWAAAQERRFIWPFLLLTMTMFFNLVTIASFAPDLWTNLMAWQRPYPAPISTLKTIALIVSALHLGTLILLLWPMQKPVGLTQKE